jgi:hypothetical protein
LIESKSNPKSRTRLISHQFARLGWRLPVAVALFVLAIVSLLTGASILASGESAQIKSVAGLMVFPTSEILDVTAIAILGKRGFEWFKAKIFRFLRRHGPPAKVSSTRHHIGLILLVIPIIVAWLTPYFVHLLPGYEAHRVVFNMAFDLMFVTSFFVLWGEYWDKVRALFVYGTKVQK